MGPRTAGFIAGTLVMLFLAATVLNLCIQWMANIMGARRYSRDDPVRAALVVAASQYVILVVYASVVGMVLFYRLRAGGEMKALVPAVASVLACAYFLRLPDYILQGLYGRDGGREGRA